MAETLRVITCANCKRDRLAQDVFWHKKDREWYCTDVFACEYRLYCQYAKWERRNREAVSVDWHAKGLPTKEERARANRRLGGETQ